LEFAGLPQSLRFIWFVPFVWSIWFVWFIELLEFVEFTQFFEFFDYFFVLSLQGTWPTLDSPQWVEAERGRLRERG
jgi:hypothetical protein